MFLLLLENTVLLIDTQVESGEFSDSEIIVMLGENGTGKTTFIRMLGGYVESEIIKDGNEDIDMPEFNVLSWLMVKWVSQC